MGIKGKRESRAGVSEAAMAAEDRLWELGVLRSHECPPGAVARIIDEHTRSRQMPGKPTAPGVFVWSNKGHDFDLVEVFELESTGRLMCYTHGETKGTALPLEHVAAPAWHSPFVFPKPLEDADAND